MKLSPRTRKAFSVRLFPGSFIRSAAPAIPMMLSPAKDEPGAGAEGEVNEGPGHDVAVHEFLGTLVYDSRGGSKIVHFWRMEAGAEPVRKLMRDVKAVEWLPLADAVERLSLGYERAFLENVG